jgi:hypothetical protein
MSSLPRWLFGEPADGKRCFVICTAPVPFICEVFDEDDPITDGPSWSCADGQVFGNFQFPNHAQPDEDTFRSLCREAEEALAQYDGDLDI